MTRRRAEETTHLSVGRPDAGFGNGVVDRLSRLTNLNRGLGCGIDARLGTGKGDWRTGHTSGN